jgi:predicted N-acetyltransferase YhbS
VLIRREAARDIAVIHAITAAAFTRPGQPPGQDPPEARLVDELRASPAWLPRFQVRVLTAYQPWMRGMFTYPEPFDRT